MAVMARAAYALLFCVALPALLAAWSHAATRFVRLPAYGSLPLAVGLAAIGATLVAFGVVALWRRGGGLPMNAFPPPKLVASGLYRWMPHPIYSGFSLLCFAVAMAARSPGGLWLVAPATTVGCAALVFGYEKPDLVRRFGAAPLKALCPLPPPTADRPNWEERLRVFLYVLLPWLAIYETIAVLGVQDGALDTRLPFEVRLPVWTWTEAIYASTYLGVIAATILAPAKRDLRNLMIRSWLAMATVFPLYLFLPTFATFRQFTGGGLLADLLRLERSLDMPAEALPSFHVIWAILAACAMRSGAAAVWASAVAFTCVTTGMHSIADVAAGAVWGLGLLRFDRIWEGLRAACERIANSWVEWRIGRFRLINHAFYGALSTFACLAVVGSAVRPLWVVGLTAAAGLVGAALWAQSIEGSSRLLRPFGFYGGLLSVISVSCFMPEPWTVMGAYALAGPWLQAMGRLRCLVQGCCHGRPADYRIGIRYRHPRSRVCRIAGLEGVPLHPTALYSILCNMATALVLARLWWAEVPVTLIGGLFLIFNGLGRFVEEAYRGEPQTPILAGLRLYQWIAIATVAGGAAITVAPGAPAPGLHVTLTGMALAGGFGVIAGLALGFDAPESNRRFGRLT